MLNIALIGLTPERTTLLVGHQISVSKVWICGAFTADATTTGAELELDFEETLETTPETEFKF